VPAIFPEKFITGDVRLWAAFASVDRTEFGTLNGVEEDVEKSPDENLRALVDHPAGSFGATTVSNFST
jgi:hypothetical protein